MTGFSAAEIKAGRAVGIRPISKVLLFGLIGPKLWLVRRLKNDVLACSFKIAQTSSDDEFAKTERFFEFELSEVEWFNVMPVPKPVSKEQLFAFVYRRLSISLLHIESGRETLLVTMNAKGEKNFIKPGYVAGEIPDVKLYYFEHLVDHKDETLHRTLNVFELKQDFWQLMELCQGIPPISQKLVLKGIMKAQLKQKLQISELQIQLDTRE